MACPSSMASERKPPELTPSTTFDNISFIAPHRPQGVTQVVMGPGVVRPDPQGLLVSRNRLLGTSQYLQSIAPVVMRSVVLRIQGSSAVKMLDRLIGSILFD